MELAKAYVQIVPSMQGFKAALNKEMTGAVSSSSSSLGEKLSNLGGSMAKKLATTTKVGLVTAGTAVGGAFALSIKKGFGRLSTIEQAQKGLEGMGLTGEQITEVMKNANQAVKGTAYGLGDAAKAAKGLAAAGIKPGQEMTRALSLVGDVAAQSGASLDEMGYVFNKIAAGGKLQAEEANMLLERGIPVWQSLADSMGLSVTQVQALASKGKISFNDFQNAMEKSFGGSALKMGDTVKGSFDNMMAAAGRFGAMMLEDVYPMIAPVFQGITSQIDEATKAFQPFVKETVLAVRGIGDILDGSNYSAKLEQVFGFENGQKLAQPFITLREEIKSAKDNLAGVREAFERAFTGALDVGTFSSALTGIVKALGNVGEFATSLATGAMPILRAAFDGVVGVGGNLLQAFNELMPHLSNLAKTALEAAGPLTGAFSSGLVAVSGLLVPLASIVGDLADGLASLPTPILAAGTAFLAFHGHIGNIQNAVNGVVGKFTSWKSTMGELPSTFDRVTATLTPLQSAGLLTAKNVETLSNRMNMIGTFGGGALDKLKVGFSGLGMAVRNIGASLKAAFISNGVTLAIMAITTAIGYFAQKNAEAKQEAEALAGTLDKVTGAATQATREFVANKLQADGIAEAYMKAGGNFRDLTDAALGNESAMARVKETMKGVGQELRDGAGHYIGYKDTGQDVIDTVQDMNDTLSEQQKRQREVAEATQTTEDKVRALQKAQDEAVAAAEARANKFLRQRKAERDYQEQVEETRKTIQDSSKSFNDKERAVESLAEKMLASIEADKKAGKGQEYVNEKTRQAREQIIEARKALGDSQEQAEQYANALNLIPGSIITKVDLDQSLVLGKIQGLQLAVNKVTGEVTIDGNPVKFNQKLSEIPGLLERAGGSIQVGAKTFGANATLKELMMAVTSSEGDVTINGKSYKATQVLGQLMTALDNSEGTVSIDGSPVDFNTVLNGIINSKHQVKIGIDADTSKWRQTIGALGQTVINVGVRGRMLDSLAYANGGLVRFFASGSENHVAQVAPAGAWRVWAEPETGGEAYIPLARSKRRRSLDILAQVASEFGYQMLPKGGKPYADGYTPLPPAPASPSAGAPVTINVHVNPRDLQGLVSVQEFIEKARLWQKGA